MPSNLDKPILTNSVGQKVYLGFSITSCRETQMKFLANQYPL